MTDLATLGLVMSCRCDWGALYLQIFPELVVFYPGPGIPGFRNPPA